MTALGFALAAGALAALPGPAGSARLRAATGRRRRTVSLAVDPASTAVRLAPLAAGGALALVVGLGPGAGVAIVGSAVVELWRRGSARGRLDGRRGAWVSLLDDAVARLRAGESVAGALGSASGSANGSARHGAPAEVATKVAAAVAVSRLGGDPVAAMAASGDPVAAEIAAAWRTADRHGIPAADVLDRVRADLADRRDRSRRVEASLAGPRATGTVLGVLPPVGVLLGTGLGADPLGVFSSGVLGAVLAVVGSGLLAAGLLWTDSLVAGARP